MAIEIRVAFVVILASLVLLSLVQPAEALSPCEFAPASSNYLQFNVKGDFQWFDDSFIDERDSIPPTGTIEANFTRLIDESEIGYRIDGSGHAQGTLDGFQEFQLWGAGGFKRFLSGDQFILGAADLSASLDVPKGIGDSLELPVDLEITAGGGIGRFKDVTPLSKAIRLQNSFLDTGVLLGPFTDEKLHEIAQILSIQGTGLAERIEALERVIEETGMAADGNLGARALLELESIIESQAEARLCGWEAQASVGLDIKNLPPSEISETLVLNWNYAVVPDPVTQITAGVRLSTGLDFLTEYALRASASLARRLSDNLRARASYTITREPAKPQIGFIDRHHLTMTFFLQLSKQMSLTINGEFIHATGYEERSRRISAQLSYDIF